MYILEKERPFSDIKSLLELQRENGVSTCHGKGSKCQEFVDILAEIMEENPKNVLENNFLAVMNDGFEARKTREEKELWSVFFCCGKVIELLLKFQNMRKFGGVTSAATKKMPSQLLV